MLCSWFPIVVYLLITCLYLLIFLCAPISCSISLLFSVPLHKIVMIACCCVGTSLQFIMFVFMIFFPCLCQLNAGLTVPFYNTVMIRINEVHIICLPSLHFEVSKVQCVTHFA